MWVENSSQFTGRGGKGTMLESSVLDFGSVARLLAGILCCSKHTLGKTVKRRLRLDFEARKFIGFTFSWTTFW